MPRRSRPWAIICPPSTFVFMAVMTFHGDSLAYDPLQSQLSFAFAGRSWFDATSYQKSTTTWSSGSTTEGWHRKSRNILRMKAEREASTHQVESAVAPARPTPFVSRRLGSFEKMLTQTRDGFGPAEEGVRTLLTPHVWVRESNVLQVNHYGYLISLVEQIGNAVWCPNSSKCACIVSRPHAGLAAVDNVNNNAPMVVQRCIGKLPPFT